MAHLPTSSRPSPFLMLEQSPLQAKSKMAETHTRADQFLVFDPLPFAMVTLNSIKI